MQSRLGNVIVLIGCVTVVIAPGCTKRQADQADKKEDAGIARTALRGPVKLAVKTDRSQATIAERFRLTITVEADDGVDVTMPQFGASLGALSIRDFTETSARPIEGGKRRWRQEYEIDCDLSGKYEVKPITVTFVDRRKDTLARARRTTTAASQPGVTGQVNTDPFELEVTSLLEGQFDPTEFRDVKGPAELPVPPVRWPWWVLGGVAGTVVIVVLVVMLIRRRRRRGPKVARIPPHEWAMAQLQQLIDDDLLGQELIQPFYYRLNAIVRQYIELRYELMAPEMTTEEFLDTLRTSDRLAAGHKGLLERFLAACDMVKYACYRPGGTEIEEVFAAARDFIDQTTERGKAAAPVADDVEMQESAA